MALLAEEIVEEWLNRHGFFTIRGAKAGAGEIDLLAVRPASTGLECRHLEVQASSHPMSFLTPATKAARDGGWRPYSPKARTAEFMRACVHEWCEKKYSKTARLREQLAPGPWRLELVVHRIKHAEEIDVIRERGILIHYLDEIVKDVLAGPHLLSTAAGGSLIELVGLQSLR